MFSKLLLTLATFLALTIASALPPTLKRTPNDYTPLSPSPVTVQQELGSCLAKNASLHFPSSPNFHNYTQRWSAAVDPDFAVVVIPAVDRDVSCTVKFANKHNVPFLTVNQAHGSASALSSVYNGIEIYISALNSIEIAHDGNSALMGGGTYQDQVVRYLAAHGKATATASCGCLGMMGPGLGGGFGKYQGYFGLVLDNIISMNVVLADGSMSTVSASSMPDLYWGMRGAGHNFGIVTSFNHKIYNEPVIDWFVETMIFTYDKLEAFWENLNALGANGTQPVGLVTYATYAMNPEISKTAPVIILSFQYAGTKAQAEPLYAPFLALNPVVATNVTVPYAGLAHATGAGVDDAICAKGLSWKPFPVGLQVYNITTNRAIYDLFSKMVSENPAFNNSVVQFEGYSMQAVKAVDPASTAYAHRDDNLLVSYSPVYPPEHSLDPIADTYGRQARAIFHAGDAPGRPLNTYTNYASSDETPEQMYGYEPWRLARLRALKKKYDPKGRFNFYAPVNSS